MKTLKLICLCGGVYLLGFYNGIMVGRYQTINILEKCLESERKNENEKEKDI